MRIKFIKDEDFINYKKSSMFIGTCTCNFKCCTEIGVPISICQNQPWCSSDTLNISDSDIVNRYITNPLTHAIVFGGLEPFDQFDELYDLIKAFREKTFDDIVIYTGYYDFEIQSQIKLLKRFDDIIVKYGRYVPNKNGKYDNVLGVTLASDNQYAVKIS